MNLFSNISEKNKEKLLKLIEANTVRYHKDINVLSGEKLKNYIAIIESGCLQMVVTDYNGNNIIMEELKENDVFGSMITNHSDEYSIITKEDTVITYIDYDEISNSEIVKTDFYIIFMKNLLTLLTNQLSVKDERIQILTKRSTRDKILEYFKILSKGLDRFEIPFSFTELANYLCVDRAAMTRELKHLKDEGFIKINNRQIILIYNKF